MPNTCYKFNVRNIGTFVVQTIVIHFRLITQLLQLPQLQFFLLHHGMLNLS